MTDPSSPESSSKSSILSNFNLSAAALKAVLRDAAELPSWELCASSTITAKHRDVRPGVEERLDGDHDDLPLLAQGLDELEAL